MALLATLLLLVGSTQLVLAGPVMGKGPDSGKQVKKIPDRKPMRCIGPVNMSNGMVLPTGKVTSSLKYVYVHKGDLYDGSDRMTGDYNGKYDRVNRVVKLTLKAGLFKNFDARVMAPFFEKEVKRKAGPKLDSYKDDVVGLGDIVVMGRYALMTQRSGDWFNLAIGAGLKIPTGDPNKENQAPFSAKHQYMGPGVQLGTGSWDPKFELGATKFMGRSRVDAHCMLTLPGDGAHGSRKGTQLKYDLGYGYALNRSFDVELEFNGVYQEAHIYDSDLTVNTGGTTLYITPGVHWKIDDAWHLSLGVPVVFYRDLNGESATPDSKSTYGIGEDFQVVARLGYCF